MKQQNPEERGGMLPFPTGGVEDPWEAIETMSADALRTYRAALLRRRAEMDDAEPSEEDEEAYDTWAEEHEELEDLIDEITDRLEEEGGTPWNTTNP